MEEILYDNSPIGVFDSGIGGLTVLKSLLIRFPQESFIYLGDTARLPYGSKSAHTIRKYSEQIILFLKQQNVKAVIIACNSASSQVQEDLLFDLPIFNVISPGAKAALQVTKNNIIAVLGTRATVQSNAYSNKIKSFSKDTTVFSVPCPLFVPLAEEGMIDDPITDQVAQKYLTEVLSKNIDTLILGCTHYPILKNAISKVCGSQITLIDSGEAIADELNKSFLESKIKPSKIDKTKKSVVILTTDFSVHFNNLAHSLLNESGLTHNISYQTVDL